MKKIIETAILVLAIGILYVPIVIIAILSFNNSVRPYEFNGFTLKWYAQIFQEKSLYEAIVNTWFIALLATFISTSLGIFISLGISQLQKRYKNIVLFLNNMPILNADIVTGISLMLVFTFFNLKFGMGTMLLGHIFFCIPFVVLSILPRLKSIDSNTYDAARDLGCTHLQAVFKVIIPAIKTGIISGALIAFTMSIDDFIISYFTTGDGFANFSTWIYARLNRRSFSPAAYSYNTIITIGLLIALIYINLRRTGKNEKNN